MSKLFKLILPILVVLIIAIGFLLSSSQRISADSTEDQIKQKSDQIKELEGKLKDAQNQAKTLSLQISVMNNQIKLTELRMESTKQLIAKLDGDIDLLGGKIDTLEGKLKTVSELLLHRIAVAYKQNSLFNNKFGDMDPVTVVFASDNLGDFVNRAKYIQVSAEHDRKLLFELEQTKVNYNNQKETLTVKQKEQEELEKKLVVLSSDLATQKKDKEGLLEVTKNDEKRYQQLLEAALAEKAAFERALTLPLKDGQAIKLGDAIAIIGNSGAPGCSTGAHLHFEVRKDGNVQNPADYLKNKDVEFNNSPDGPFGFSGSLEWPIESPKITQGYGMTNWARTGFYGGGPHTGIDMVSGSSSVIRAVKDGTLYKGSTSCKGSTMNYVAIDHGGGIFTWYFHVK